MSEFKIEKNIPLEGKQSGKSKYPFSDMKIGDSFFVKADSANAEKVRNTLMTASNNFKRMVNNDKLKFSTRLIDNGVRIWRIV